MQRLEIVIPAWITVRAEGPEAIWLAAGIVFFVATLFFVIALLRTRGKPLRHR